MLWRTVVLRQGTGAGAGRRAAYTSLFCFARYIYTCLAGFLLLMGHEELIIALVIWFDRDEYYHYHCPKTTNLSLMTKKDIIIVRDTHRRPQHLSIRYCSSRLQLER